MNTRQDERDASPESRSPSDTASSASHEPTTADAQTADVPTADAPAEGDAAGSQPAPDEPAPDEPAPDEPAPDEPAPDEPAPDEPAPGEQVLSGPAPAEPAADEPAAQPPTAEAPAPDKSAAETPAPDKAAEPVEDPWAHFAPQPERPPTRRRRLGAAVGRVLLHEWTLASVAGLLLAAVMTWPTLARATDTLPQDIWDPTLQAWQVAWGGHALMSDPNRIWDANAFWPDRYSYAFSDSLLGYSPFGMVGTGAVAAILRYNILFVLAYALAFVGAYALARQFGAGRAGAAVAGIAFAYAPWRLAQAGHLHVMSSGGIVLALAMLARGHGWSLRHGYRPQRRRAGWALAGWLVAAWQITLGFGIGLPFAYALALIVVVAVLAYLLAWVVRRRPRLGWSLVGADLAGGLIFGAVCALMALPYLKVADLHPYAKRSPEEIALYSAPLHGFLTAPPESWLWGDRHASARALLPWPPEMTLLPGFVLLGLAAAGLLFSIWRVWTRLVLAAAAAVTVALGMGTQFADAGRPGYMSLYDVLPGWNAIRTPGRLVLWTTLLLAILAAGAVSAFAERAIDATTERLDRPRPWLRLATLIPVVLVLIEGINQTPHPIVPTAPVALREAPAPILVLPSDQAIDQNVMLWSTDGFPKVVNGSSGFVTASLRHTREVAASFPDAASITYLRELGVRTVILLPGRAAGTPWERAAEVPVEPLGIARQEIGGAVVYTLS
jgi:hypothetical protein